MPVPPQKKGTPNSKPSPGPEHTAKIASWQADKGYGWLQLGDRRIFLHVRDYSGPGRQPVAGEEVRFTLGQDAQGRPCATRAVSVRGGRTTFHIDGGTLLHLACFLILPAIAIARRFDHPWLIGAGGLLMSLLTFVAYACDKRRARANSWRIPEAHLHLLELLGGWPGAWLAQKHFRHKSSKTSYHIVFWLIVLLHQFVALDSLQNWRLSQSLVGVQ